MDIDSIPTLNHEGLLPPFVGGPTQLGGRSPYQTRLADLIKSFGISQSRLEILDGFVRYRRRLFQVGLKGFQWVNGSFVQRLEREPGDIDVVTVVHTNIARHNFLTVVRYNMALFSSKLTKANFMTDAYLVDASALDYYQFTRQISYWFGLFSHTREGSVWKGLLELALPNSSIECDTELALVSSKREAFNGQ